MHTPPRVRTYLRSKQTTNNRLTLSGEQYQYPCLLANYHITLAIMLSLSSPSPNWNEQLNTSNSDRCSINLIIWVTSASKCCDYNITTTIGGLIKQGRWDRDRDREGGARSCGVWVTVPLQLTASSFNRSAIYRPFFPSPLTLSLITLITFEIFLSLEIFVLFLIFLSLSSCCCWCCLFFTTVPGACWPCHHVGAYDDVRT